MLVFLRKVIVDLLVSGGPEPAVTSGQPEDLRWPFAHRYSAAAAPAPQPETAKLQKITHTPKGCRTACPATGFPRRIGLRRGSQSAKLHKFPGPLWPGFFLCRAEERSMIRNVAIIAHVDHGKTTLVDQMLRQAGAFRENQVVAERVMDSNPLERERGITILSKNTSVRWAGHKINIVDTPGQADFGGEVERILRMVDGALLRVDAFEGRMPQTGFVTRKALALGLSPIVVINKVDRADAEQLRVHEEVLELFLELEAGEAQLDAPFLYASAREGYAVRDLGDERRNLTPLFETILAAVPAPPGDAAGPFQMLVSTIDHSPYLGRLAIGRIERGTVRVGDAVALLSPRTDAPQAEAQQEGGGEAAGRQGRVARLYTFEGLQRVEVAEAAAGDIVALAGLEGVEIGATVADAAHPEALEGIAVEEPTVSVDFSVNTSPFTGREGKFVTSRQVRERLFRELERNVALRVEETDSPDTLTVSGRGELHLTILMETMRREGYEFAVSRPRVITRRGPDGELLEPYEEVSIDVP